MKATTTESVELAFIDSKMLQLIATSLGNFPEPDMDISRIQEYAQGVEECKQKQRVDRKYDRAQNKRARSFGPSVFLGHILSCEGIRVDTQKIEAVRLGLDPQHRQRFIAFSVWQALKDGLTSAPVLMLSKRTDGNVIYCDASGVGLDCVLMQHGKVVTYDSRQLRKHEKNYPTHDLELSTGLRRRRHRLKLQKMGSSDIEADYVYLILQGCVGRTTYSSDGYARLYIKEIVRLHGVPIPIISDKGAQFTANFWRSFQKVLGTQVSLSTTFHPQTDGHAEHTIQALEDMLRACVIDFKGSWDDHLPLIEFAYNNSYNSSLQMAP
ncbi:uncharacterized protein [Nicotiana sylvestris]|uniref:uncharacterized protein n=1 Tax=Nicotiana sylvestris TaxID=4096 RepID=UPI00388C5F20